MERKNFLVTGGYGFIGSCLVRKLLTNENYKVCNVDKLTYSSSKDSIKTSKTDRYDFKKVDILDTKKIKKIIQDFQPDAIFHLAAMADIVPSIIDPIKYMNTNVMGTTKILEIARMKKVKKFIYIASSSCYGIPKKYPTKESSEIKKILE